MMEIEPIAFDSMGARGMSTLLISEGVSLLVDPGVNLAPNRHKLPPHPKEKERKESMWRDIERSAKEADVIILTHYHYDHLNPEGYGIFHGKTVFLKHPEENLNYNQRRRAALLLQDIEGKADDITYADGKKISVGALSLEFSSAVPHGLDTRRGCVVQFFIRDSSSSFLFTSDVEGANLDVQLNFIIKKDPDILFMDGPAITFPESRRHRIQEILSKTGTKTVVVDHHLMRETNWKEYLKGAMESAFEKKARLISASEFKGEKEDLLEARRVELYSLFPVS